MLKDLLNFYIAMELNCEHFSLSDSAPILDRPKGSTDFDRHGKSVDLLSPKARTVVPKPVKQFKRTTTTTAPPEGV